MTWLWVALGLVALAAFLYWQLIIAEGAYLGRRVVAWLYDLSAKAYDNIKSYEPGYEQWFLGLPLSRALATYPDPLLLDVATGTARLARTLCAQAGFHGRIIGVDYSRKMLRQAVATTQPWADRLTFIRQDAAQLPFPDATFDVVSCLEALEFMPHPEAVLHELARVLRPGGIFLITNRIGRDARLLPGRSYTPEAFEALLQTLPLEMIRTQPWQEDYDLVWAVKSGVPQPVSLRRLEDILQCPICAAALRRTADSVACANGHSFPAAAGFIDLA